MIKSLKEIDEQLEIVEASGVSYEVNPSQFIAIAAPLLIKICELAKVLTRGTNLRKAERLQPTSPHFIEKIPMTGV